MDRAPWEYTLREVAILTGVSVDTAKRRLKQGCFPHARQQPGPVATWLVPLQDVVSSGLHVRADGGDIPLPLTAVPRDPRGHTAADLVELRIKAAVAEAEARVHRFYADALRGALNRLGTEDVGPEAESTKDGIATGHPCLTGTAEAHGK